MNCKKVTPILRIFDYDKAVEFYNKIIFNEDIKEENTPENE